MLDKLRQLDRDSAKRVLSRCHQAILEIGAEFCMLSLTRWVGLTVLGTARAPERCRTQQVAQRQQVALR